MSPVLDSPPGTPRVLIAGGGISGLSTAFYLQSRLPEAQIILIERDATLGGKIRTENAGGFVVEAGPDSFLASKPGGIELCRDLGLEHNLIGTDERYRRSFVLRNQSLYPLPDGLSGLIPARVGPVLRSRLLSLSGKVDLMLDLVRRARRSSSDESLAEFTSRRLGNETYRWIVEPLMAGIFAGDGEQLSLEATFPQLRATEQQYGSLIRGLSARKQTPSQSSTPSAFVAPRDGMWELVRALRRSLDGIQIIPGKSVVEIRRQEANYEVSIDGHEKITAHAIVLAVPAWMAGELTATVDQVLSRLLFNIPYVSTATVSLAYPRSSVPRGLDGYGYVVPRAEGGSILACTWTSSKFQHRAPPDYALLRLFIGRAGMQDLLHEPDDVLFKAARDEVKRTLRIRAEPIFQRIFRWHRAMPQYTMGHLQRVLAIDGRLKSLPGLYLAGNAYRGIGIPDSILSGKVAADRVADYIRSAHLHATG